jgi:hypothetical protein
MALFLFVVIVAIALGLVGAAVKGLFFLLIIGVVLFLAEGAPAPPVDPLQPRGHGP